MLIKLTLHFQRFSLISLLKASYLHYKVYLKSTIKNNYAK